MRKDAKNILGSTDFVDYVQALFIRQLGKQADYFAYFALVFFGFICESPLEFLNFLKLMIKICFKPIFYILIANILLTMDKMHI